MRAVLPIAVLQDNYAWALCGGGRAIVVDPGEAAPVRRALAGWGCQLAAIWLTHHHHDHIGGVGALREAGVPVVGAAADRHRLPPLDVEVADGDEVDAAGFGRAEVLSVPGHTLGSLAFFLPAADAVFTGDTLFLGGCGRLMEGSVEMMAASLARLAALPGQTAIYCGHEYTERNYRFALAQQPQHPAVRQRLESARRQRAAGQATVPATLQDELATNPFLRLDDLELRRQAGADSALALLTTLRRRRDHF